LELLGILKRCAVDESHKAALEAVEAMEWTEQDFKFLKALSKLEALAENSASQEERALILEDTKVWRKHWDSFLRSESGGQHNLTSFLGQVALGATQQPRQDGLALLTVHSAKGLEFDVVVVMGMAEGIFPDYRARGAALEEEKRNAFVAVTRSKRLLCFSYAQTRVMPWGETRQQQPSRYLKEIGLI
jgi:DNA helicase-2/ATP-dependent DNA helicase PcrA